jgi:hypothetical protein
MQKENKKKEEHFGEPYNVNYTKESRDKLL